MLKGEASAEVTFREPIGHVYYGDYEGRLDLPEYQWGYETDCGPVGFQSDPKGTYLVVGLTRTQVDTQYPPVSAGTLVVREVFFQGSGPSGRAYDRAIDRTTPDEFPYLEWTAPVAVGGLVLLGWVGFMRWRRGDGSVNG